MKKIFFLISTIFLFSCQTLPLINSPASLSGQKSFTCPSPFLKQKYRLVHSIETRMAGNTQSAIIGVTLADPFTRSVSCAIITAEGMTLFEAESGPRGIKVRRALPPFDSADFAKNMIDDIKLIFLAPEGKLQAKGRLADGSTACRYQENNGEWIDVTENKSEGTQIKRYTSSGALKRQISFMSTAGNIYQRIELRAKETFDYSLLMTLIEAQPVKTKTFKRK
ncbi:MAG: hypothetical protein CVU55_10735 [Deltaproteobacteria bacterium HGW-Deltaproteobacteria-13]|jgi:hypothetical protein|nr:MAG: hypothetical protein CVU55_10735 [Deltaproteobacteria bacterium HGW-Deltaproteobacteria-13]